MQLFETTFTRSLTELDWKQNLPFPFHVPVGTTRLNILLEYAPHQVGSYLNMLTLTVFDPHGWRGSGHRHGDRHEVALSAEIASPGFLPGPLPPGEWTVEVDTHMILPGPACEMRLTIRGDDAPVSAPVEIPLAKQSAPRGPGWYRGDLHGHSRHSDAGWDAQDLLAYARAKGLDFTTLSDHNTVAGIAEAQAYTSDDLCVLGGMELTTFRGHALALGIHHWVDWRLWPGERSMAQVAQEVDAESGLFVIAHPTCLGDPYCTGCDWRFADLQPGIARAVEVWNMDWRSECNNEEALALAYGWLNQGHRLALTAGADNHGELPDLKYGWNVVYAEEFSEADILRAVAAGHLYLSSGPQLELDARAGAQRGMIGDALDVPAGERIKLSAGWSGCSHRDRLALIVDGIERTQLPAVTEGAQEWRLEGGQAHWALVTLRDSEGTLLALTNPIYFDGRK